MRTGSMRVAEISLPAIRHNVRHIREITGGAVIAVVKANGYGHGADIVARAAVEGGAELLAVADLEEALSLREAGIDAPLLCWLHGPRVDFDAAVRADIEIGVSHLSQLEALAAAAERAGRAATVQFKLDTGLSRNGAAPAEWAELFARGAEVQRAGHIRVRGIFSHLANAGAENDRAQAAHFDEGVAMLREAGVEPEMIHLAASAATFSRPELHYNTVRVGVAVVGLSPFADRTSADLGLVPAMTLRSEIVALREVAAGTGVSYGYNHVAQSDTTLALVPMGYADGMPRALNGAGATVAIAGKHCPIVGRIGMDQCIIDLGSNLARRVGVGEPVILFGDPSTGVPPVEVWSDLMQTINYELIVSIGPRVLRVAVDGETGIDGSSRHPGLGGGSADGSSRHPARSEGLTDGFSGHPGLGDGSADGFPRHPARSAEHGVAGSPPTASPVRIEIADPDRMHAFGVTLGRQLGAGDLVILTGPLGAGKTTLTRGIGEGLGVRGPITSPTFVLARTHPSLGDGPPLVHVDAYRLADPAEADDLDLDFDGSVVVAEWGAGLIEDHGSWVEIVIDRPVGSAADASTNTTDDFAIGTDEDFSEAPIEPRIVTVTGRGQRWEQLKQSLGAVE